MWSGLDLNPVRVIAAVGAVAGLRAIGDSRMLVPRGSVSPVVRDEVGGGMGLTRALSEMKLEGAWA